MSQRTLIGSLVGLAGGAALAWGIHGLMLIGTCGGDGAPPCPPEATPYFIAVAVGMPASILAGIFGRTITAFTVFPAVTVGALWAAADLTGGARTTAVILGVIFGAISVGPIVLIPLRRRKRRQAMRLITEGGTAIGTITSIRDTGVTINRNPRVTITYRIEPEDGSLPFDGEKTMTVSRVNLPREGHRYPIWYDRQDRSQFAVGTKVDAGASPEVRRLFEKAAAGAPDVFGMAQSAFEPAAEGSTATDPLDRLAKLNELRLAGALTEDEFQNQKARILEAG